MKEEEERNVHDRLTRMETLLETHLTKVVNGLDLLTLLKAETDVNSKFREEFYGKVKELIKAELGTSEFRGKMIALTDEQIDHLLASEKFVNMIEERAKNVADSKLKKIALDGYVKITVLVTGLLGVYLTAVVKGWVG